MTLPMHLSALFIAMCFVGHPTAAFVASLMGDSDLPAVVFRAIHAALAVVLIVQAATRPKREAAFGAIGVLCVFWAIYGLRIWNDRDLIEISNLAAVDMQEFVLKAAIACWVPICGAAAIGVSIVSRDDAEALVARIAQILVFWGGILTLGILLLTLRGNSAIAVDLEISQTSGRLTLQRLDPISLGNFAAITLLAAFYWVATFRSATAAAARGWSAMVFMVTAVAAIVLLLFSASRGPMVQLLIVLYFGVLFLLRQRRVGLSATILGVGLLAGTVGLTTVEQLTDFRPMQRLGNALGLPGFADAFDTVSYRQDAINAALSQFIEHPLFGDAIVESATLYYPHNIFVEVLMAVGIVGAIPMLDLMRRAALVAWRVRHAHGAIAMLCPLLLCGISSASSSGNLTLSTDFWAVVAVMACLAGGPDRDARQPIPVLAGPARLPIPKPNGRLNRRGELPNVRLRT